MPSNICATLLVGKFFAFHAETGVIEASQCKKILGEVVGGPLLLVPTTVIGNAAMPVVVEQPTAAPLGANVGSPERVEEEEKQREFEKIAVEERQRDEEEKKEAEEEKQQSEEAEEKKEEVEQKRQELDEGKENVADHQTELEKSEIFRGRYY